MENKGVSIENFPTWKKLCSFIKSSSIVEKLSFIDPHIGRLLDKSDFDHIFRRFGQTQKEGEIDAIFDINAVPQAESAQKCFIKFTDFALQSKKQYGIKIGTVPEISLYARRSVSQKIKCLLHILIEMANKSNISLYNLYWKIDRTKKGI
jgi:hypothetical protein